MTTLGNSRSRIATHADLDALFECDPHAASVGVERWTQKIHRDAAESVAPAELWTSTNESNLAMRGLLACESWQFSDTPQGLDEGDAESVFYLRRMNV